MKVLILMLTLGLSSFSIPSVAEISSLSQAINESGRLRMLSQRMAKAYLLKAMDIQPAKAEQQFTSSFEKFESNLVDLNKFSVELGSPVQIEASLSAIQAQWAIYKSELSKQANEDSTANILALSDETLQTCETLVSELEKAAERDSARWVNLSGRQRMLSQRIAKLYSAISLSGDIKSYDHGLKQAISEFDQALNELINSPDNTHFVNHKLKKVATQWNFSKQGFKVLDKGSSTPLVISMTTESILKQMNDITALYEEIDRNKKLIAAS
ncbi:type IV pili methyl-accepting chemotaxis transducer N-terminal domain-containing protein [Bermanella sp. WJH001]|uniref:type IV pili methyl-accepting chemotaxis transducer N-terminal domain-containing protein n=1 Tax=Bermanella sp. WJH001 TaxID=3048005 RepID=UPI0024BE4B96|nr:type IV pili methyl-accepting chemotaxis transducer N-terminal domain-containing protein [Bermanella sp. WJH001]MDJ1539566.1 type IV pili methyl-accepting chemotaxis transducer N-terminal domain-containing protein [Bermanella sp. WJH001]